MINTFIKHLKLSPFLGLIFATFLIQSCVKGQITKDITIDPNFSESSFKAECFAVGDGIILTATSESVSEHRLVSFTSTPNFQDDLVRIPDFARPGQCVIKTDPPGHKWVMCMKRDPSSQDYRSLENDHNWKLKVVKALPNYRQFRGWSGSCLVKY